MLPQVLCLLTLLQLGFVFVSAQDCRKVSCLTDFSPSDCPDDSEYQVTGGPPSACCPVCVRRVVEKNGRCTEPGEDFYNGVEEQRKDPATFGKKQKSGNQVVGSPPILIQGTKCRAGCACSTSKLCEPRTTDLDVKPLNCFDWRKTKANRTVSCDPDGTYSPRQCLDTTESSRCYCVDKKNKRIFGSAPFLERKSMNCACSRKVAELQEAGRKDVTLHCDYMGNYEELQCDSGICWCVDPLTTIAYSHAVNEKFARLLPCYKADKFGSKYLRRCESVNYALAKLEELLDKRGVKDVNFNRESCDADGSYGRVQCEGPNCFCSNKEKVKIGSYGGTQDQKALMNCYCARDEVILGIGAPKCDGVFGNYNKAEDNFCRDENGNVIDKKKVTGCEPPSCPTHPVPYSVWKFGTCG